MSIAEECRKSAEDCERQAATCGPGSSRDTLLSTAAQWRRMAEAALLEEKAGRTIAPRPVHQEQQVQQQQSQMPGEQAAGEEKPARRSERALPRAP